MFLNARWTYNVTGLYQLPWDFNIGASLTGRQGYPEPFRVNKNELDDVSTNVGILPESIGSRRFSNVYELDLRAAKDFRFFNRVGVTLSADLFNVPNKRTILQRNTTISGISACNAAFTECTAGTTLGNITELQSPRVWRFGARFNF